MRLKNLDKIGISIVIVTYNGSNRIIPTLEHLSAQKNIDFAWEILVVDNNSTDNTTDITREFFLDKSSPPNYRIITEPTPGTMHARKKGIEEAHYRYILYCDDDNWLNESYVKTAFEIIRESEDIAAVGGIGIMEYEEGFTPPEWFKPYERNYGCKAQGKTDGDTTNDKGCLYTAGGLLDRKWLDKLYSLGFTSSLTGRDGKSLAAGEDTELTFALKLIGGKLYYSSKMHFKHFMPKQRISWDYLKRLWYSFGSADYTISSYPNYFNKRRTKFFFLELLEEFGTLLSLYIKLKLRSGKEGDRIYLDIERTKGKLHSMLYARKQFLKSQSMVKFLLKNNHSYE